MLRYWLIGILLFFYTLTAQSNNEIIKNETEIKPIAMTFDDGPNSNTTPLILQTLQDKDVRATFFVLGECFKDNLSLLKEIDSQGHEIAVHSYKHQNLTKLSETDMTNQLVTTRDLINDNTNTTPTLFRPVGGFINNSLIDKAKENGLKTVIWSLDPKDWQHRDTDYIVNFVLSHAAPGDTILLHDIYLTTAKAVPLIIEGLIAQGYQLVTVSELIAINEKLAQAGHLPWKEKVMETFPILSKN